MGSDGLPPQFWKLWVPFPAPRYNGSLSTARPRPLLNRREPEHFGDNIVYTNLGDLLSNGSEGLVLCSRSDFEALTNSELEFYRCDAPFAHTADMGSIHGIAYMESPSGTPEDVCGVLNQNFDISVTSNRKLRNEVLRRP
jgi:hypothetical protein